MLDETGSLRVEVAGDEARDLRAVRVDLLATHHEPYSLARGDADLVGIAGDPLARKPIFPARRRMGGRRPQAGLVIGRQFLPSLFLPEQPENLPLGFFRTAKSDAFDQPDRRAAERAFARQPPLLMRLCAHEDVGLVPLPGSQRVE